MPAPAGNALWDYLTQVKYQKSFTLWPGKGNDFLFTGELK